MRRASVVTFPPPGSQGDYVRLHITPLDRELLNIIIPASLQPSARNTSFHTVETFPEKRFGFVDLPQMDADKLKQKLNGTILKGSKLRIEMARPEERIEPTGDAQKPDKKRKKSRDAPEGAKRQKWDPEVLEGVTLRERKVKRGWTESADAKRRSKKTKDKDGRENVKRNRLKSKYTDKEECLLKVKLPPNATGNLSQEDGREKSNKKSKSREVTVHEFERTTQFPSFLKHVAPKMSVKPATEFVEGKGWVDDEGNVVEAVKARAPAAKPKRKASPEPNVTPEEESDDSTSSSGTSSEDESVNEELEKQCATEDGQESPATRDRLTKAAEFTSPLSAIKAGSSRPLSSSSSKSLTIGILPQTTPTATTVHPLEALYKRAKPVADVVETPAQAEPFSFFGGADIVDEDEQDKAERPGAPVPMTPFTGRDFERRGVRSAAPTPDTAHPSRKHLLWATQGEDDEDDEDDEADEADEAQTQTQDRSDFQTWFWDNRRELNRSWMTRRKTAAKERRHRDNKARASKAV